MKTFMQWLHVGSVVAAIGGMVFFLLALLPAAGALEPPNQAKLMGEVMGRFRVIVWLAILGISVSGIYMAFTQTPLKALRELWTTRYGTFLLVKLVLGVIIAKVSLALTLPFGFLAGIQQQAPALLQLNLMLALIVVYIAARLRRGV
jgi:putative copper export protein